MQVLIILLALGFHNAFIARWMAQNQPVLPGLGEDLGIFHCGFIENRVVGLQSVAFCYVQRVAVKMPESGQLGLVVEARHIHDKRVAIPAPDGIAHVGGIKLV